jgi:hypothetical protein
MSTFIFGVAVICSDSELVTFDSSSNQTCRKYLASYLTSITVRLLNPKARLRCEVCLESDTNSVLTSFNIYAANRWRDWGITMIYVVANIMFTLILYWAARVLKGVKMRHDDAFWVITVNRNIFFIFKEKWNMRRLRHQLWEERIFKKQVKFSFCNDRSIVLNALDRLNIFLKS